MDQTQFQEHVIDTLARLETKMHSLVGNGQPGRVTRLEEKVDDLSRNRWWMAGLVTGISGAISAVMHFVFKH